MSEQNKSVVSEKQDEVVHYYFGKDNKLNVSQPPEYTTVKQGVPGLANLNGAEATGYYTEGLENPGQLNSVRGGHGSTYGAESYRSDVIHDGYTQIHNPAQNVAVTNSQVNSNTFDGGYADGLITTNSQEGLDTNNQNSQESYRMGRQMSQFTQGRKASTMSRKLTQMSQMAIDYPGPQMLQYFNALELEAAISCGRIYAPPNASFVPGEVVKRAQMVTLYDSGMIPTFENELEINAFPKPVNPEDMLAASQQEQEAAEVLDENPEVKPKGFAENFLLKKVHQAKRRMQCC